MEESRLEIQTQLDSAKTPAERNRMGQFATPTALAAEILGYANVQLGKRSQIRFIDPAIGTGAFYSALLATFSKSRVQKAMGYEIDPHYGAPATELWRETGLDIRVEDFTLADPPAESEKFNLLICNPPYVRHHHIDGPEKVRLKIRTRNSCKLEINGLAGLYCYFLGLCHTWMADGALAGWLIPSEFMDVNYGAAVKSYLLDEVTLLHIHRFDPNDVQFNDALVSSAVVWFRKEKPSPNRSVRFTYGGSLQQPKLSRYVPAVTLRHTSKWTLFPIKKSHERSTAPVLKDFFQIKRGIATGNNRFFILSEEEIKQRGLPMAAFRPILPSPRYLPESEVMADNLGNPLLERRLFLLDCKLMECDIKQQYPSLWAYLEEGRSQGIDQRYLCRHRAIWYTQEKRPPAPFLCTYLGRSDQKNGRPFRFILNHSQATAPNVYLMLYPNNSLARALQENPDLKHEVWKILNRISPQTMLDEGRVYGGGLHKLEPKELGNVPEPALADLLLEWLKSPQRHQDSLPNQENDRPHSLQFRML